MLHRDVTIILVRNLIGSRTESTFKKQTVDITHEGHVTSHGLDGHTAIGKRPHSILWREGKAADLDSVTDVQIISKTNDLLVAGGLCKIHVSPRDTEEGATFQTLEPDS